MNGRNKAGITNKNDFVGYRAILFSYLINLITLLPKKKNELKNIANSRNLMLTKSYEKRSLSLSLSSTDCSEWNLNYCKNFLDLYTIYSLVSTISMIFLNQLQQNPKQLETLFIYQIICRVNQLLTLMCIGKMI